MTIEIHRPELEAMIQQRMATGHYENVEAVLVAALQAAPDTVSQARGQIDRPLGHKSLAQLFAESPFRGLDMDFPRSKESLRSIEL